VPAHTARAASSAHTGGRRLHGAIRTLNCNRLILHETRASTHCTRTGCTHARPVATMGQLQVPLCFCNDGKPRKRNVQVSVINGARECGAEMYSVESVRLSVCLYVLTVESLGLERSFLACRYVFGISRSSLCIKVIGSRSRSQEQKVCL